MKTEHQQLTQLQLYRTDEYPCSYLPERLASSQMVAPIDRINDSNYGQLIDLGFRRSGLYVYRPQCPNCRACQSYRIVVNRFTPNRSQRRCWKKWSHLHVRMVELSFSEEHFALYRRYIASRHADGAMANDTEEQYQQFFLRSAITSFLVEFRDEYGVLRMVSVIDQTTSGLSAMYTFYDPAPEFAGLGTYGILWQVQIARQFGLKFVYLGFWIAGSPKMHYKQQFGPAEILINGTWRAFEVNSETSNQAAKQTPEPH